MTGSDVVRRSIRTPALALVAAAGLAVWGGADRPAVAVPLPPPALPGHPSLAGADAGDATALRSGGAAGAWAPLVQPERHRQGPTGPSGQTGAAAASGAALHTGGAGAAALHLRALHARARAGLHAAPSTGPPFLPL